jgi:multidrug efflux pump subunit AcrA (membrane-fusion protein)
MNAMMHPYERQVFTMGLGLLVGLSQLACTGERAGHADTASPPVRVSTALIAMTDLDETFETGGTVQARTAAIVTSRILAPVLEVRVAPGDRVRTGQVLVVLDGRDFGARTRGAHAAAAAAAQRVLAADADARGADASFAVARASYDRIAALQAKRSATPQELDDATAALRSAEARVAAARARQEESRASVASANADTDEARATESYTQIAAPFDGVVTEKHVDPGTMAGPGTPLLRVEDTRGFTLNVRVDESRVGVVTPGTAVPVIVAERALNGSVAEVSRAVDSDARAFLVKIDLPTAEALRSGAYGRARFKTGARRALTVPLEAIVRRGQVSSVFVVADGVARLRLINVAGPEILAGLAVGERVIVAPPPDVVDGRPVTAGGQP